MPGVERVQFDFSGDKGLEAADRLEDILCSGNFGDRGLDYKDEHTLLLLRLLANGGIAIYKRAYTKRTDTPPEIRRRAGEINHIIRKRYVTQTLLDIADIFSEYEYDGGRTVYNSLFLPELKAYIRCGGLPPDRLFEMLEQDGCDMVLLFPDAQFAEGDFFHAFSRVMPREAFANALAEMNERILEAMHEASRKWEEQSGFKFPSFPDIEPE